MGLLEKDGSAGFFKLLKNIENIYLGSAGISWFCWSFQFPLYTLFYLMGLLEQDGSAGFYKLQ